jgi:aminoglycoside phosphotransferase (APT) family kinase protein
VCHGDFHPLNVLVQGESTHVIDWTDACLGDRNGDAARLLLLLREAAAGAPSPRARAFLTAAAPALSRRYLSAYRRHGGGRLDRERLQLWEPVHLVHDWARAALTVAADPRGERIRPQVLGWIRRRLRRAGVL